MGGERRVVVTGLGVISSIGLDVETYWNSLLAGKSGIRPIAGFDTAGFTCKIAGEIPQFDPRRWLDKRTTDRIDRFSQMGLIAAMQSVQDSGLDFEKEDRTRCGVIIGTGIGGLIEIEEQHKRLLERGPTRVSPFLVPKLMGNACAGQVSIHYGLQGPNLCATTACASSCHSIGIAFTTLRSGAADVILTGGSEAAITPLGMAGFCSAKALSTRNDEPEKASRPFDKDRDGFVMGEGSGILILEEYEHARRRGARIYAEVVGYGATDDACDIVQPDPSGTGACRSVQRALRRAGVEPDQVDYVNAHGTSTQLNDAAETRAVKAALGARAATVPISSTKSMTGHLLGAAGGVEAIFSILAIRDRYVPPTINLDEPDPECDLDYVPNVGRSVPVDLALSTSYGFGGHNACLAFARVEGE